MKTMNEWIDPKETLPEDGQNVLCVFVGEQVRPRIVRFRIGFVRDEWDTGGDFVPASTRDVLRWMPLPSLPAV
jgi:hypothetical protein